MATICQWCGVGLTTVERITPGDRCSDCRKSRTEKKMYLAAASTPPFIQGQRRGQRR